MTTPGDYAPTPAFSDEQGKAYLTELWDLHMAIDRDPETGKKVRHGTYDERAAIARLRAALLKIGAHFELHREFGQWLYDNTYDAIEAYDPISTEIEITNKLADFDWRLKCMEESNKDKQKLLFLIVQGLFERLPPELVGGDPFVLKTMINTMGT